MRLFQDFLDQSKQLNQAPSSSKQKKITYHPPNKKFKTVLFSIKIPNLPAPLHYLNFFTTLGFPNSSLLFNESVIRTTPLDTATVFTSTSLHMVGQLNSYSMKQDCQFDLDGLQFENKENIKGTLPNLKLKRIDNELAIDLNVSALEQIIYFSKLRFNLAEHWSVPAKCLGQVIYKKQIYEIEGFASVEFARSINFPYIPFAFYVYQIINLDHNQQIIFMQYRNAFNHILYSRIFLRNIENNTTQFFDHYVRLRVDRVYPVIKTPNGHSMYLPREFCWTYCDDQYTITLQGTSRGDFKFGLGTGFVGSFCYQLDINDQQYVGEGGYCEYIDCRSLKWQEQDQNEKFLKKLENSVPLMLKK